MSIIDRKTNLLVIVGPTASGKSDLAVKLAKKLGGEIISADSRQVYRGMDIGTAKITRREMKGVIHHLLDVVSPRAEFNVTHFVKLARKRVNEIIQRGKVPVVVGGTAFWIDALVFGYEFPEVKPDKILRNKLEKLSTPVLFKRLEKLDSKRAGKIDRHNRRRLIRALEIIEVTGKPITDLEKSTVSYLHDRVNMKHVFWIGLNVPKSELDKKIKKRLLRRLRTGLIVEVKKLHSDGVSWRKLDGFGLEYRYVTRHIRGLITKEKMIDETYRAIIRFSKRQMTWWKRNKEVKWFASQSDAIETTVKFYKVVTTKS